jgi:hypothetical protein
MASRSAAAAVVGTLSLDSERLERLWDSNVGDVPAEVAAPRHLPICSFLEDLAHPSDCHRVSHARLAFSPGCSLVSLPIVFLHTFAAYFLMSLGS